MGLQLSEVERETEMAVLEKVDLVRLVQMALHSVVLLGVPYLGRFAVPDRSVLCSPAVACLPLGVEPVVHPSERPPSRRSV